MIYTNDQITKAIDAEARDWAKHFDVADEAQIEGRRAVMRANVSLSYLDPLKKYLPNTCDFTIKRTRLIDETVTELPADASTIEMISCFNSYLSPSEVYHSLRVGKVIYGTFSKWERA